MDCRLKKSLYDLLSKSQGNGLRFAEMVTSFGFKEHIMEHFIYLKISRSKSIILV